MKEKILKLDLQLFAEGGAASGDGAGQASGENAQAAAVQQGENAQAAAEDRAELYKKFKTDYKAEFDTDVQNVVKERLKKAKEFERNAKQYQQKTGSVFEALAVKYGLDASDIDGIVNAVNEDNSYYENEALEKGMDVSQLRHIKQIERENAALRLAQQSAAQAQAEQDWYADLALQAVKTKEIYPNFDMNVEVENNPQFKKLVEKGVDVLQAYQITHMDEVMAGAMQYAAQQTASKIQTSVDSNKSRPSENGLTQNGAVATGIDIKKLSRAQMEEYKDRALRGEKIDLKS